MVNYKSWKLYIALLVSLGIYQAYQPAFADTYTVTNLTDLNNAIASINISPGTSPSASSNQVNITTASITLSADLAVLQNGATFTSTVGGTTISGANAHRLFSTYQSSVSLQNLTLTQGLAQGGSGFKGGGGGMGAGGGVFVDLGQTLTLSNTTISSCTAQGGAGANIPSGTVEGGGGGASFSVNNKNATSQIGGGDRPGSGTSGGASSEGTTGYGGGNGGTSGGTGGAGGGSGAGGAGGSGSNVPGGAGGYCGGGGGGGHDSGAAHLNGGGGGGGNGGGGGGAGQGGSGESGGGGGGYGSGGGGGSGIGSTLSGAGGGGGFGGGGGLGGWSGGGGGFGGGGGGGDNASESGFGGSYGGKGSGLDGGGGGAGIGGGIFVADSATLSIGDTVALSSNNTIGGTANGAATPGSTLANDIFLFRSAQLQFTGASNSTVSYAIQGDTAATTGNLDAGVTISPSSSSAVIAFTSTNNTYRGGTTVSSGTLQVGGANMPTSGSISVTHSGTLNINATTTPVSCTSYTNSGIHKTTITDATTLGKLTSSGAVTLSGSTLQLTAPNINSGSYTVITGSSISGMPTFSFPALDLYLHWVGTNTGTQLILAVENVLYQNIVTSPILVNIAAAVYNMSQHITNSGQQELISAVTATQSQYVFNNNIQQLLPNTNAFAPNIPVQNKVLNKIETRLASLHNGSNLGGINVGDNSANRAYWFAGFASTANQQTTNTNFGYQANSFGGVLGVDNLLEDDTIFGYGAAFTKTNINERSNSGHVTGVYGLNGLVYGTIPFTADRYLEWLLTGVVTYNKLNRDININNISMNTHADYYGAQAGMRFNYAQEFVLCDFLSLTPFEMLQYYFGYQPDYSESPGPAALHVTPERYQNLLTIGAGLRTWSECPESRLIFGGIGAHALITWDLLTPDPNSTSFFIVGSENFFVAGVQERVAYRVGFDLAMDINCNWELEVTGDYEYRKTYNDFSGMLKLKYLF